MGNRETRNLKKQIRHLQKENAYLRHRLLLHGESGSKRGEKNSGFAKTAALAEAANRKTYLGYLMGNLQKNRWFRIWDRTRFAVKWFFTVTKLWNFLLFLLVFLGVSAQVLLFLGGILLVLPAMLLLLAVWFAAGYFAYRREYRSILLTLRENPTAPVCFIFVKNTKNISPYTEKLLEIYQKEGVALLVSPSFLHGRHRRLPRKGNACYCMYIGYFYMCRRHLPSDRIIQII